VRQNDLRPVPGSVHKRKRVGRGNASGHGTYATRGIKGQKSRTGRDLRIGFEGGQNPLIRGLSRKRGFNNRFRVEYEAINVGALNKLPSGATVTPEGLRKAGIVKSNRMPVKLLGDGELTVALTVEVDKVSAGARAKIEAAGGRVVIAAAPAEPAPQAEPAPRAEPPAAEEAHPEAAEAAAPAAEAPASDEAAAEAKPARRTRARARPAAEEPDGAEG